MSRQKASSNWCCACPAALELVPLPAPFWFLSPFYFLLPECRFDVTSQPSASVILPPLLAATPSLPWALGFLNSEFPPLAFVGEVGSSLRKWLTQCGFPFDTFSPWGLERIPQTLWASVFSPMSWQRLSSLSLSPMGLVLIIWKQNEKSPSSLPIALPGQGFDFKSR